MWQKYRSRTLWKIQKFLCAGLQGALCSWEQVALQCCCMSDFAADSIKSCRFQRAAGQWCCVLAAVCCRAAGPSCEHSAPSCGCRSRMSQRGGASVEPPVGREENQEEQKEEATVKMPLTRLRRPRRPTRILDPRSAPQGHTVDNWGEREPAASDWLAGVERLLPLLKMSSSGTRWDVWGRCRWFQAVAILHDNEGSLKGTTFGGPVVEGWLRSRSSKNFSRSIQSS